MRRALAGATLALAGALAGTLVAPGSACACSCVGFSETEARDRADVVFVGRLARREEPEGVLTASTDPVTLVFEVTAVTKGDAAAVQGVRTASSGASCGLEVSVGQVYEVYARDDATSLRADLCGGTRLAAGRPGPAGSPPASATPTATTSGAVPAGVTSPGRPPRAGEAGLETRSATPVLWSALGTAALLAAVGVGISTVRRRRRTGRHAR